MVVVVGVLILLATSVLADYRLLLLGRVLVFTVSIAGLVVVSGLSGQLSLAHSAFMGVGAYTSALLVASRGWPWLATLPVSMLLGFVVGLVVAIPAVRVRGLYLALVTLSIGVLFPTLVRRFEWFTGGANGKSVIVGWEAPGWFPFEVSAIGWQVIVLFVICAAVMWLLSSFVSSGGGRALVALRDNEIAAETSGVRLVRSRALVLGLSAAVGALAGSMVTLIVPVVSPDGYGFALAVELITGLVVGGLTRMSGAVLGGLLVVFLPYYAAGWSEHIPFFAGSDAAILANAIYGVILIVIVFTMPGGLASGLERVLRRFVRVQQLPSTESDPAT